MRLLHILKNTETALAVWQDQVKDLVDSLTTFQFFLNFISFLETKICGVIYPSARALKHMPMA